MESHSRAVGPQHSTQDKVHHFFTKQVQEKIQQHPCYSKEAHQYARMHLPVAPACNIQCNYCNRKYDCSNESRPGVVSRVMDSSGALRQFNAIKKRAPNLTVAGIAGPGDALANPKATFTTLRLLKQAQPDVQLCISTNGLALADHVEQLAEVGVHHLTITINTVDPEVGEKIYPWIYFNNQRLRGREAAQTLIERQLLGLEMAALAGMLVKVNTVLIPGINDHHVAAVSEEVKKRGALLHNIMPLISDPSHGTYFGLSGQRGPTEAEVALAREQCGGHMPQMTHCQQCRADAVGMLGNGESPCSSASQSNEHDQANIGKLSNMNKSSSKNTFRVAIASDGSDSEHIQLHFGHATRFEIYLFSEQSEQFLYQETRHVELYCNGKDDCDDGGDVDKQALIQSIADCQMVLSARMGITPWRELEKLGVQPNVDFAFQSVAASLDSIAKDLIANQSKEVDYELCHQQ